MEYRVYGYARVSSKEQNTDRQIQALMDFGVDEHNIIVDKKSGKDMKREGYASLKNFILRSGDTLVVVACHAKRKKVTRKIQINLL